MALSLDKTDLTPKLSANFIGKRMPWKDFPSSPIESEATKVSGQVLRQVLGQPKSLRTSLKTSPRTTDEVSGQVLRQTEVPLQESLRTSLRTSLKTNFEVSTASLLQKRILIFIADSCKNSRSEISAKIKSDDIVSACSSSKFSVVKAIQRMVKIGVILRMEFCGGNHGWTRYKLKEGIYEQIEVLGQVLGQIESVNPESLKTSPRTSPLYSSSSILINKTTTTEPESLKTSPRTNGESDPFWTEIDFSSLEHIGFNASCLAQLKRHGLKPDMVQTSLNAFAFDLEVNNKAATITKTPLEYLMAILRRESFYSPPPNYETPQQIAKKKHLAFLQAQAEKEGKLEKDLIEVHFSKWVRGLSQEEKRKVAPLGSEDGTMQGVGLRAYFEERIWPGLREEGGIL